jgi:hypothetical protein
MVLAARLGIEALELARSAIHPEQNHRLVILPQLSGASDQQVAPADVHAADDADAHAQPLDEVAS